MVPASGPAEPSNGQAGADGVTRIVEVGAKAETEREATAEAWLVTTPDTVDQLLAGTKKGSPIETAKIAGIIGVKETPRLLPHCHPVRVTGADIVIDADPAPGRVHVMTTVRAVDRTGVEMEALTAAAVAALSLYDTAKAFDRSARIEGLRLLHKSGGKSGEFIAGGGRVSPS
jgi:cyclic pyranopterin monophosphate synthase